MKAINLNNLPFYHAMFFDLLCTITSFKKRLQSTCCDILDIPIIPDQDKQCYRTRFNKQHEKENWVRWNRSFRKFTQNCAENPEKLLNKNCNILYTPFITVYFWLRYFTIMFFLRKDAKIGHGNIDRLKHSTQT